MAFADRINGTLRAFIEKQPMFFVATAARDGRVNVSPKGMDTLRIVDERRLVWLNLSGSGNETAAHIADTNRMTLMFCAFEGPAMILRVYGTAQVTHARDAGWAEATRPFPDLAGSRQVFDVAVSSVQTSCGTGVPFMELQGQCGESELVPYWTDLGPDGTAAYWRKKNTRSIDGMPTGLLSDE